MTLDEHLNYLRKVDERKADKLLLDVSPDVLLGKTDLKEYIIMAFRTIRNGLDDFGVYKTNERSLDSLLDCTI